MPKMSSDSVRTHPAVRTLVGVGSFLLLVSLLPAQTAPVPATAPAGPDTPAKAPAKTETSGPTQNLEAYTVTGSNIRRVDAENSLPVTVIDRDEMDLRGASTPAELFDTVTMANPPNLTEQESAGQSARGDNTSIDFRGLSSGSTLVLVNNRRMPPHPISQSENGVPALSVNINTVPGALANRVEILRDGASAIYGSDAAAGVVNYFLTPTFDGLRTSARATMSNQGGGNEFRSSVKWGRDDLNGGRTRIFLGADFFHRDALVPSDRWWAQNADQRRIRQLPAPWNGLPLTVTDPVTGVVSTVRDNDFDNSSSNSTYGSFIRGTVAANGSVTGARPTSNRGIATTQPSAFATMATSGAFFLSPLADGTTGFRQTTPSRNFDGVERDYYANLNNGSVILPKTDRFNAVFSFDHRLSDRLTAYGEFLAYRADSVTGRTAVQIDFADAPGIVVGVDNPYNPFGSRFYHATGAANADGTARLVGTPSTVAITLVKPADFRNRVIKVTSTSYRASGGMRGKLGNNWDWDGGFSFGSANTLDIEHGNVRESRLREALLSSNPAAAFNPFGHTFRIDPATSLITLAQPYQNSAAVLANLDGSYQREAWSYLGTADLKVTGSIWELWGNDIGFAAGLEARYEGYKFRMPPYAGLNPTSDTNPFLRHPDNDFILLSPNVDADLDRMVYSAFAEVNIPLITPRNDLKLARSLEVSLATRIERFPVFGNAIKPKATLSYSPVKPIKFRASVNESFKAPNVVQVGSPRRQVFASAISDPYRFEVTGLIGDGSTGRTVFRQGGVDLVPEEATNYVMGVVVDVPFIKGLSFTADLYKINQNNVIANAAGGFQLRRDEELLDLYVQSQLKAGVNINSIDLGSGTAGYKGNPKINRAAVNQADRDFYTAFNATRPATEQRAPVGAVVNLVEDFVNLAGRDLDGAEFGLNYRLPRSETFGQFTLGGEASFRHKFELQEEPGLTPGDDLYEDGRPKWRYNASLRWRKGSWSAGWFTSYFGKFVDTGAATTAAVYETLGRPDYIRPFNNSGSIRYLFEVEEYVQHNASATYRFGRNHPVKLLRNTDLKVGINNVFDTPPPISDSTLAYESGAANPRGQQFWLEIDKRW